MAHVLTPDDPDAERRRLLGRSRYCRGLARSVVDSRLAEELLAIAKSYEAKASMLAALCDRRAGRSGAEPFTP